MELLLILVEPALLRVTAPLADSTILYCCCQPNTTTATGSLYYTRVREPTNPVQ